MEPTILVGYQDTEPGHDALALGAELSQLLAAEVVRSNVEDFTRRSASQAIRELAVETKAIAIVLGSSRWSTIGRLAPGSTAEQLLHSAPCPVAVAPRGFSASGRRILHIAVGYDGSTPANVALDVGIAMAESSHAELTILTSVEGAASGYVSPGGPTPAVSPGHNEDTMRKVLEDGLARVPAGLPVRSALLHGDAGMALTHASEDFDLMLVGARDYGPVRRMLLGSTSRRLLRSGACAAMAVPTGVTAEEIIGSPAASIDR
jgi:nucleotide-binding universal stress UspA family protein